jgi:hypothetical protein
MTSICLEGKKSSSYLKSLQILTGNLKVFLQKENLFFSYSADRETICWSIAATR